MGPQRGACGGQGGVSSSQSQTTHVLQMDPRLGSADAPSTARTGRLLLSPQSFLRPVSAVPSPAIPVSVHRTPVSRLSGMQRQRLRNGLSWESWTRKGPALEFSIQSYVCALWGVVSMGLVGTGFRRKAKSKEQERYRHVGMGT